MLPDNCHLLLCYLPLAALSNVNCYLLLCHLIPAYCHATRYLLSAAVVPYSIRNLLHDSLSQDTGYLQLCHLIPASSCCVTWLYRRESNLALSSSPVTKKQCICLVRRTAIWMEHEKISSSVPGLGLMTHREYWVDCPFPVTWLGNVWEPSPPPAQYRPEPTI